ncbi:MAG TPA: NADH-quinone oxidoreductase subunit L [Candidatus Dormibacteraeota bacterium]|nr:NADH-quinone oxidoreductase subunit L [Candidatus Dormibacteraeota bacterium]
MNWLPLTILLLPAVGGALLAGRGWRWPRMLTVIVGPGVVWLSFLAVLYGYFTDVNVDQSYWTWIKVGDFTLPFNLILDHLSLFMCLVITGVGGLIVTYAVGYMGHEDDPSYARFFCYMDVFVFSMLLLVLAGSFVFLIVGWAMVGLSSYLLIGFYYWRHSAVVAARKAFVMNVIGDIGMILGTFVIFFQFHAVTYHAVFAAMPKSDSGTLELAAFLFLVGAVAKSAQLPLHTWLPDAMEGPTPVSALIHAATMVTAGVYLIGRLHPLYDVAPYAHHTVAIIGALSALVAATIAIVQTDIKRVLAYSTMSQIGYMFLAVGVGAYAAAFFHLLSHAFFKALLFMSAGNVIHAMDDEQDMRRFGGLWRQLRGTSISFLIGSLALVGVIPLVGFFSKEFILGAVFSNPDPLSIWLWVVGFGTAILTGFYTGRMWWIAFWGKPSSSRPVAAPQEAPAVMLWPVLVLAALTIFGGALQSKTAIGFGTTLVEDYLRPVVGAIAWPANSLDVLLALATMVLALVAFGWAYLMYVPRVERRAAFLDGVAEVAMASPHPWNSRLPWAQTLLEHKYYFDELYDWAFVRPLDRLARWGDRGDRRVIDGSLAGVAGWVRGGGRELGLLESGYFRSYILVFVGGAVVAGLLVLWRASTT